MNLRTAKFAVVDVETTGLNTKKDEIIALAIVPMDGMRIKVNNSFYSLVKPKKFDLKAMKFHNISPAELENALSFEDIAKETLSKLKERVIVGFCVEIDYQFLRESFKRLGINFSSEKIDVLELERVLRYKLGEGFVKEDANLESIANRYKLEVSFRHNALADAIITAQIFQRQILSFLKYGVNDLKKLNDAIKNLRAFI